VLLHQLRSQPIDRPAHGGQEHQHVGAADLRLQGALDRLDLAWIRRTRASSFALSLLVWDVVAVPQ